MPSAKRPILAWLLLLLFGLHGLAHAADAPQVDQATPLFVLRVQGATSANVRALPDPRSATLLQVLAGSSALRATGAVRLYGDTWWVEIQSGSTTGWLNARLVGRELNGSPLQAYVKIDALQPVSGFAFKGAAYIETTVTSFDECARACIGDAKCLAIEYRSAVTACRFLDQRFDVTRQSDVEIAAKSVATPPGGWAAQSASRFDRLPDQGMDVDGYRAVVALSIDECSSVCGLDQRCAAFGFDKRKRLCSAFERVDKLVARAGVETGIRQTLRPPTSAQVLVGSQPLPSLSTSSRVKFTSPDPAVVADTFSRIFVSASQAASYAQPEVNRQGGVTLTLAEPAVGGPMHAAAMPRQLDGTLHNLAVIVGRNDHRLVHLVFYTGPGAPPVILASSTFETADAATAAALLLQKDVDDLAKLVGLGVDPLSLLKPLRR